MRDGLFLFCILVSVIIFAFKINDIKMDMVFEREYRRKVNEELLLNFERAKNCFVFCVSMLIFQTLICLMQITC